MASSKEAEQELILRLASLASLQNQEKQLAATLAAARLKGSPTEIIEGLKHGNLSRLLNVASHDTSESGLPVEPLLRLPKNKSGSGSRAVYGASYNLGGGPGPARGGRRARRKGSVVAAQTSISEHAGVKVSHGQSVGIIVRKLQFQLSGGSKGVARKQDIILLPGDADVTKSIMEVPDRTVFRRNRQLDEIKDGESGDGSPLPDEKWSLAIVVNTDVEAAVGETQPIWIFFNGYVDSLFKVLNQGAGEGEQGQGEGEQKSGSADDPASAKKAGRGAFGWLFCCCGSGVSAEELAKEDRASKDGAKASSDAGAIDGSAAAAQDEDGSPGEDLGKGMRPGGGGDGQPSEDSGEDGASDNDRDAADGESAGGRDGGGGRARPAVPSINTGADGLSLDEWKAQGRAAEQGSEQGDGIGGKEGAAGAGHAIVPFSPQGKGTAKDGEKRSVRFDAGTKEDDDEDWQSGGEAEEDKAAHAGGTVESAMGADRQSIAGDGSRPEPVAPAGQASGRDAAASTPEPSGAPSAAAAASAGKVAGGGSPKGRREGKRKRGPRKHNQAVNVEDPMPDIVGDLAFGSLMAVLGLPVPLQQTSGQDGGYDYQSSGDDSSDSEGEHGSDATESGDDVQESAAGRTGAARGNEAASTVSAPVVLSRGDGPDSSGSSNSSSSGKAAGDGDDSEPSQKFQEAELAAVHGGVVSISGARSEGAVPGTSSASQRRLMQGQASQPLQTPAERMESDRGLDALSSALVGGAELYEYGGGQGRGKGGGAGLGSGGGAAGLGGAGGAGGASGDGSTESGASGADALRDISLVGGGIHAGLGLDSLFRGAEHDTFGAAKDLRREDDYQHVLPPSLPSGNPIAPAASTQSVLDKASRLLKQLDPGTWKEQKGAGASRGDEAGARDVGVSGADGAGEPEAEQKAAAESTTKTSRASAGGSSRQTGGPPVHLAPEQSGRSMSASGGSPADATRQQRAGRQAASGSEPVEDRPSSSYLRMSNSINGMGFAAQSSRPHPRAGDAKTSSSQAPTRAAAGGSGASAQASHGLAFRDLSGRDSGGYAGSSYTRSLYTSAFEGAGDEMDPPP